MKKPLKLSATAIEDYQNCPLKFKFNHFLKIPTGPAPALTFGSVMHQCARHYFELRVRGVPDFAEIEKFYLEQWRSAGFEDTFQEQTCKRAGLEQLRRFVDEQNAQPVDAGAIRHEQHFSLDLGDTVLEGRIDQINPLSRSGVAGNPSRQPVELVDYKTGKPRSQKDADKSLQLSVYALAAKLQGLHRHGEGLGVAVLDPKNLRVAFDPPPVLIEAVKGLKAENTAQKAEIESLKTRLDRLEQLLSGK